MIIPNRLNLMFIAVFLVVGILALPLADYGLRLAIGAAALVLGFVLNALKLMGGGDAKFIAAMLPYVSPLHLDLFLMVFAVMLILAFLAHRLARSIPAIRGLAPHWKSWTASKFPMGLALGSAILFYLAWVAYVVATFTPPPAA